MTEPQGPDGAPKRLAYGWHCLDCYHDIGVRTSNAIEMLHDIVKDGKSRKVIRKLAGKSLVCAHCLGRGKITHV